MDRECTNLFDLSTHKIYPFWFGTSFSVSVNPMDVSEHGYLRCSYTGDVYTGNGSYYSGRLFFYSTNDIRYSPYPPKDIEPKALRYYDQIHGFRTPVKLPQWAESSIIHQVAWYCFGRTNAYQLRGYVGKHLTIESLRAVCGDAVDLTSFGGTLYTPYYKGFIDCMGGKAKLSTNYAQKPDYVFTIGDLCKALNEILTPQRQLTLF